MGIPILARRSLLAMLDRRGGMKSWRLLSRNDQPLLPQPLLSLLDRYPSSKPAWALHRLRGAHSGACIRVRRVSDNVEADIGFATDGSLDVSALASHCGASDGRVTVAYDQNDTGVNYIQPVLERQMRCYIGGTGPVQNEHGKPALQSTEAGFERLYPEAGVYGTLSVNGTGNLALAMIVTKSASDNEGVLVSNGVSTVGGVGSWSRFAGAYEAGSGTSAHASAGNPTHYVNGVAISPNTRGGLHDALEPGGVRTTVSVAMRPLTLLSWSTFTMMGYQSAATAFATDALVSGAVLWFESDLTLADFHDASAELRELFEA
jgi:hypothetical protein